MTVVSRFGLLGDYDAMGDLEALADDLRAAIDELSRAAGLPASGLGHASVIASPIAGALQRALSSATARPSRRRSVR